jgi:hypothetical protein
MEQIQEALQLANQERDTTLEQQAAMKAARRLASTEETMVAHVVVDAVVAQGADVVVNLAAAPVVGGPVEP